MNKVLKAFVHGDENLFNNYPELQEALVWVYFHSNIPEFNKVECWGPLKEASSLPGGAIGTHNSKEKGNLLDTTHPCPEECTCCFPPMSLIPWAQDHPNQIDSGSSKGLDQQTFVSGGPS
ncbi:hypothetical protein BUALT_Bualt05G0064600 [Buddleja alternifolia]|uniref:Staygreen protein domain-containing protein n=1 Tax=Buddleja alternifolia TaxID=168488 RepID=A0AAV6XH06_9LAMI|nr:hypothetical protein BUALT_Bualt05G0064600 [Buddleja alternifolia]